MINEATDSALGKILAMQNSEIGQTRLSDAEYASAVKEAADQLNRAIAFADAAGLSITGDVAQPVAVPTVGHAWGSTIAWHPPHVTIRVWRPL